MKKVVSGSATLHCVLQEEHKYVLLTGSFLTSLWNQPRSNYEVQASRGQCGTVNDHPLLSCLVLNL